MNKRIKELAERAGLPVIDGEWDYNDREILCRENGEWRAATPAEIISVLFACEKGREKFAELIVRELVGTLRVDDSSDGFYYNEFNDWGCIIVRFYVEGDPFQMQGEKVNAGTQYSTCRLNERFVDHLMRETFGVEK